MPKLKNLTSILQTFGPGDLARTGPEPWLPTGQSWSIKPNEEKTIFEDDYAKSRGIKAAVAAGTLSILDETEPVPDGRLEGLEGGGGGGAVQVSATVTFQDVIDSWVASNLSIVPLGIEIPTGASVTGAAIRIITPFVAGGSVVSAAPFRISGDFPFEDGSQVGTAFGCASIQVSEPVDPVVNPWGNGGFYDPTRSWPLGLYFQTDEVDANTVTAGACEVIVFYEPAGGAEVSPSAITTVKFSKTYADFADEGPTKDVSLGTLPAGAVIFTGKIKHSQAFTGGLSGHVYALVLATVAESDFDNGENFGVDVEPAENSTGHFNATINLNTGSPTEIRLRLDGDALIGGSGAPLSDLTQGVIDIWISYIVMV